MDVTPYLIFNGNCEQALKFYEKALGAKIDSLMRYEGSPVENKSVDSQKIMHAHLTFDGNVLLMASDAGNEGPVASNSGMAHLSLNFNDPGKMQNVFAAMSDGGTVTMPLQDTFWGATFGMLTDQFGVNWMFNYDKR